MVVRGGSVHGVGSSFGSVFLCAWVGGSSSAEPMCAPAAEEMCQQRGGLLRLSRLWDKLLLLKPHSISLSCHYASRDWSRLYAWILHGCTASLPLPPSSSIFSCQPGWSPSPTSYQQALPALCVLCPAPYLHAFAHVAAGTCILFRYFTLALCSVSCFVEGGSTSVHTSSNVCFMSKDLLLVKC